MAGYGTTTQRPSTNSPPPPTSQDNESGDPTRKGIYTFSFSCPFNIPSTRESAAVRTVRNLEKFGLYYVIFVWTVLFITLIPERKVSIVYLVVTTEITFLYSLLLRALPDSVFLHKIIDKRVVFFLLFVITSVEMVLTRAAIHLFVVLAATTPIILVHAVLSKREDVFVHEEDGEIARLVQEKLGDPDADKSENLV